MFDKMIGSYQTRGFKSKRMQKREGTKVFLFQKNYGKPYETCIFAFMMNCTFSFIG